MTTWRTIKLQKSLRVKHMSQDQAQLYAGLTCILILVVFAGPSAALHLWRLWQEQMSDDKKAARMLRRQQRDEERHRHHFLKKKSRIERKLAKGMSYHLGADGEIVFDSNERRELEEDRGR